MPYTNATTAIERAARMKQLYDDQMLEYSESMLLYLQTQHLLNKALSGSDLHAGRGHRATMNVLRQRMETLASLMSVEHLLTAKFAADRALKLANKNMAQALRLLRMDGVTTLGTPAVAEIGVRGCVEGYPPCPT